MDSARHPPKPSTTHWYLEDNPLLWSIPTFATPDAFAARLAYAPLAGLDVSRLDFISKHGLLAGEKMPLQPLAQSIRVALTWYGMLRTSYQVRNPFRAEARRIYWASLNSVATGGRDLPAVPVAGMSVQLCKGPTGTAKTATAKRFCDLLGPQCVMHGALPQAGWKEFKQLIYLYTDLSHDGSRGGFLVALLLHMDLVLGTHYAETYPKIHKSLDRLAVATVGRLIAHHTGIVFIDEGQLRNLMVSDQADLMQLFLLSLMNSGIPLVFIGNERAFDWLDYSQDLTRLKSAPPEYFHPVCVSDVADAGENARNADALFRGVSSYYVLDVPPQDPEECKLELLRISGGIGRIALTIWTQGQLNALHVGRNQLTVQDLIDVYEDRSFDDTRPLVDGFSKRLPELLLAYPDVDAVYYAKLWGKPLSKPTLTESTSTPDSPRRRRPPVSPSRRVSGKQKLNAEKTRKAKACAARENLLKHLDPDDLRAAGLSSVLLTEFTALRQRIEQESRD